MVSRTGRNKSRYGKILWFPVLEEIKAGTGRYIKITTVSRTVKKLNTGTDSLL